MVRGWLRAALPASAMAALVFVVYALGACPTIYVGDSGELVTAVDLLGIPHPTGYPLYVLLGKLWTLALPIGSVSWRMSLFSAACAAAACGVLYALLRRARIAPAAAATAALLLAFSPSFWSQANIQRVYSLGALFVLLATAAVWRWHEARSTRALVFAFFLCGLGAANHTFMALYAVALAVFAFAVEPALRVRTLARACAAFAVGLLPYAYLPLRSRADPRLDWGNPETLDGFLGVILRRDFWERAWIESPADLLPIAGDYARSLGAELTWVGAALAALGVVAGWRRGWPVLLGLILMFANVASLAAHGSRSDLFVWHRYYIPSYVMLALLAGLGCQVLGERLPRLARPLPLVIPLFLLATGWQSFDRSRYRIGEDFSLAVLRSLPPGAHLVATDDNILFSLIYLTMVEQQRPDVNLILQGVGGADLRDLHFDPDSDPVFFTHHPNWDLAGLEVVPVGLLFQAWRTGRPPPDPALPDAPLAGEDDPRVPKDYLTQNLIGHFHYMQGVSLEGRDWLAARREFEEATAAAPRNDVLFYNLGLIFHRNGLLDDAVAAFERSKVINPRHLPSSSQPRASDRLRELAAEKEQVSHLEATLADDPSLRALERGTPAHHRALASLLVMRGKTVVAHGHRLRALELDAHSDGDVSSPLEDPSL
jgi:tetratricopeptide (TPR) repeat protein